MTKSYNTMSGSVLFIKNSLFSPFFQCIGSVMKRDGPAYEYTYN